MAIAMAITIFQFTPTAVFAEEGGEIQDVYIDNTVDNSMSFVTGKVVTTNNNTGEVTAEIVYDQSTAVTYSNPRNSTVQGMIDAAYTRVYQRAIAISLDFNISTDERTGDVWDHRGYTTVEDGDAVLIGDTDYLEGAYGVNDQYTRTHIASGDYGKNTYYTITANVIVSSSEPETPFSPTIETEDGQSSASEEANTNISEGESVNTNTNTDVAAIKTTSNPQTGDNIILYIAMLGLSIFGLIGAEIYTKKKLFSKN